MVTTEEMEAELLDIIERENIVMYTHCFGFTSFSIASAYLYEIEKLETIKSALKKNRAREKVSMIKDWKTNTSPAVQIARYRLMADEEELRLLTVNNVESKNKTEITITPADVSTLDPADASRELMEAMRWEG
jgi:predicted ATP-dependent protease